ncbi:hypothetical protein SAMN04487785_10630 [Dyella jiangningensis]|uniref:hypothetical protein n=1 Tax=Dyella sp. AtDHG13 TaxID=1938897 RepID=UPI000883EEAD|nr:hypothetical protein [Dyella sp. AtDHG13]PXV59110.1 hypothetical protein BDW41_104155 [Dyella sp. AtDHG13]SDK22336.1 hypothetical protein SAMN04487785_10630 [Dyella jiangningensis]
MKGWIRWTWMGCIAAALALGAPLAHADGGTITFSGAVVAPTCAAGTGNVAAMTASPSHQRFDCAGSSGANARTAPTSYTLTVEPLDGSALSADRLASYFSAYVKASGHEDAHVNLVTQAYD